MDPTSIFTSGLAYIAPKFWPTNWMILAIILGVVAYAAVAGISEPLNWTGLQPIAVRIGVGVIIALLFWPATADWRVAVTAFLWFIILPLVGWWLLKQMVAGVARLWNELGRFQH